MTTLFTAATIAAAAGVLSCPTHKEKTDAPAPRTETIRLVHAPAAPSAPAAPCAPSAPLAAAAPAAPSAPCAPAAPAALSAPAAPSPFAAPRVLTVGHPHADHKHDVKVVELARTGDSISITRKDGKIVITVDGEVAAKLNHADGDNAIYKLRSKDGKDYGALVAQGRELMFTDEDEFEFEFDGNDWEDANDWLAADEPREVLFGVAGDPDGDENVLFADRAEQPRVFVGITMENNAPRAILERYGLQNDDVTRIAEVIKGYPAQKGGVKSGDIIYRIDGKAPANIEAIRSILSRKSPGDPLTLDLVRDDKQIKLVLELEAYRGAGDAAPETPLRAELLKLNNQRDEILAKIEDLKAQMESVGRKMSAETNAKKLQELGSRMGQLGAEVGKLSAELAMRELRTTQGFPSAPALRNNTRIVVPEGMNWTKATGPEGERFGQFEFFLTPDGEMNPDLAHLEEMIAKIVEENEHHAERYTQEIERYAERIAERAEQQAQRAAERAEQLMARVMERAERESMQLEHQHDEKADELDARLDELDHRLDRLEKMLERLLERNH